VKPLTPLILLCCWLGAGWLLAADDRPNVLMIAVDDLRPELNCYGVDRVISPHIDSLAASGTLFERAYVQQAVCGPSRISIMSGLGPDTTGISVNKYTLREKHPDLVTMPQHFKNNGYRSISLGKIYHHPHDDQEGWTEPIWRPFNIIDGWRNYRLPENRARVKELHAALPRTKRERTPLGRVKGPAWEIADMPDNVYPDGLVADMAVHTLDRLQREGEPFFLAMGFYKPHLPFACPQKYWDLYDPADIQLPENDSKPEGLPDVAFVDSPELRQYDGTPPEGTEVDDEMARKLIHGYLACVSYMDAQVGRVLDALERFELDDNTIVVLWGDHGWHLREAGIWGKMTNFELGTNVPLIVRAPGQGPVGKTTQSLVEMVDLYPTLSELAGLEAPDHLQGVSFASVLADPQAQSRESALSQFPRQRNEPHEHMGYTLRTDRYRYTKWVGFPEDQRNEVAGLELYDHENDPQETQNLAADPKMQDVLKRLDAKLQARVKERGGQL